MLRRSHHRLSRLHHPDKGGIVANQQRVQQAFDVLSDTDQRRAYDNGESSNGEDKSAAAKMQSEDEDELYRTDSEDDSSDEY